MQKKMQIIILCLTAFLFLGFLLFFILFHAPSYQRPILVAYTSSDIFAVSKINLNTASKEELSALDGIGEVLAERIVHYRETNGVFQQIEEIMEIKGIGEKKFEAIQNFITVS